MRWKYFPMLLVLLVALIGCDGSDNDPVAPGSSRAPGEDLYITATDALVTIEWKVEGYYDAATRENSEYGEVIGRIVYAHHHFWFYYPVTVTIDDFGHNCCNDTLTMGVVGDDFWLTLNFANPADVNHPWVLVRMWGTVDESHPREGEEKWAWPPSNGTYTRPDNKGDMAITFIVSYTGKVIPVPAGVPADVYRPCD